MITKIIHIISNTLRVDPKTVTPASTFDELGIDSLDLVDIIMNTEEMFNIAIGEDIAGRLHTVGDLFNVVRILTQRSRIL